MKGEKFECAFAIDARDAVASGEYFYNKQDLQGAKEKESLEKKTQEILAKADKKEDKK